MASGDRQRIVPIGLISVMPQRVHDFDAVLARSSIIEGGGTAAAEQHALQAVDALAGLLQVRDQALPDRRHAGGERHLLAIRSATAGFAPSIFGPGNTSFAPTIAQPYGSAQALTWNIGTTGSTTSAPASPIASGSADA